MSTSARSWILRLHQEPCSIKKLNKSSREQLKSLTLGVALPPMSVQTRNAWRNKDGQKIKLLKNQILCETGQDVSDFQKP